MLPNAELFYYIILVFITYRNPWHASCFFTVTDRVVVDEGMCASASLLLQLAKAEAHTYMESHDQVSKLRTSPTYLQLLMESAARLRRSS